MRLREMEEILERNVISLELNYQQAKNNDNQVAKYEIRNIEEVNTSIKNIKQFGFINDEVKLLDNVSNVLHDKSRKIIIDTNQLKILRNCIDLIKKKTVSVIKAIRVALPKQEKNSISIKMPSLNDLSELNAVIKDLDSIFSQTVSSKFPGKIKLQNFDTGSNWIEIIVENKEAILFIGSLIKSAVELIKNHYIKNKQTRNTVNELDVDVQAKEQILKALENSVKAQAQFYAKTLIQEYKIDEQDHEYHSQLTRSIEKFSDLITRGTEVHTALNAPEETSSVFPSATEQSQVLIESARNLITDGSQDQELDSNPNINESNDE